MFACTHHPQSAQLGNSQLAEIFAEARNEDLANVAGKFSHGEKSAIFHWEIHGNLSNKIGNSNGK